MFASDQAELYTVPDKQRQKKIQIQLHSPEETKKKKKIWTVSKDCRHLSL